MAKLLVVGDDEDIRRPVAEFLESCGHEVLMAADGESALATLDAAPDVGLIVTHFRMAPMGGLELVEQVRRRFPDVLVIPMTADATVESAVAVMKAGAYDYLTEPLSSDQVRRVVERALEVRRLRAENRLLREAALDVLLAESRSPAMQKLMRTARQAASSEATIVVLGESGAGKNVLAREIHEWSRRRERSFVVVSCTTLSDQLLESELFGHMRGSFTGAVKDKPGRLEAADGGTVFLDEIADLSPTLQTKLLRFLQERRFERLGGDRTIEVDARIIAASNRDPEQDVAAGSFCEDLFSRPNVIRLRVPPLRERVEDIPLLAESFLAAAALRSRRSGLVLSSEAMKALCQYRWPGNVRELRNTIERAAVLGRNDVLTPDDLADPLFRPSIVASPPPPSAPSGDTLADVEREHIRRVLSSAATLEEAAATLGIGTTTLWRKRKRYGFD
jgi:NtrC-family two-component system response regulator AlgB